MTNLTKPLRQLAAEIRMITFKEKGKSDFKCTCVFMNCPACGAAPKPGHSIMVPYCKGGGDLPDGMPVWQHISGTTIDDLTLSPSYHLRKADGYCGLHGFIKNGTWC